VHVRAITLNIQGNAGDPQRFEEMNRELRRLDPDLVALQEVMHTGDRKQLDALLDGTDLVGTHQAQVMAYEPPWTDRYGGSAVATRWPHRVVEVLDLRQTDAPDVPWCSLAASVASPLGDDLLFIATTTAWRLDAEAARERQVAALTDLDARHRGMLPTIIAGDFNATPDAASIRYLTGRQSLAGRSVHYHDAWEVAGDGPGFTWSIDNPAARAEIEHVVRQPEHRRRLDYVFVGSWHAHPNAHCRIEQARLAFDVPIDGTPLSDHYGVVVDLDIGLDS
jgi:endonuclease/exonuclease/phosphatase family metal-dependent hydrolase